MESNRCSGLCYVVCDEAEGKGVSRRASLHGLILLSDISKAYSKSRATASNPRIVTHSGKSSDQRGEDISRSALPHLSALCGGVPYCWYFYEGDVKLIFPRLTQSLSHNADLHISGCDIARRPDRLVRRGWPTAQQSHRALQAYRKADIPCEGQRALTSSPRGSDASLIHWFVSILLAYQPCSPAYGAPDYRSLFL